jgi:SAM-dependent methyltransferase
VIVTPGGGALNHIVTDTTPFAHRDAAVTAWVLAAWDDPAETEQNTTWAHTGSIALDPFAVGICLNLTGEESTDRIETAFGNQNFRRLQAIKQAYDPTNIFRANHNIPPGHTAHPGSSSGDDVTTTSNDHTADASSRRGAWEHWWAKATGAPGEIVWAADESDLAADIKVIGHGFGSNLPVIDLGCGDGRQTRFLARHFETVVGVDCSPTAVARAVASDNPANVSFRVLDATAPYEAEALHREFGDVNVYVRGVIQALPVTVRRDAAASVATMLGRTGTLFAKELPPEASQYFNAVVQRHGLWPELARLMRLVPPGQITEAELVSLFSPDRFRVIATGAGHIETINHLPDGERIRVPAIYLLSRPATRA